MHSYGLIECDLLFDRRRKICLTPTNNFAQMRQSSERSQNGSNLYIKTEKEKREQKAY